MTHCANWTTNKDNNPRPDKHQSWAGIIQWEHLCWDIPVKYLWFLENHVRKKGLKCKHGVINPFVSLPLSVKRRLMSNISDLLWWLNINSKAETGCSILMTGSSAAWPLVMFMHARIFTPSSTLFGRSVEMRASRASESLEHWIVFYNRLTHQNLPNAKNQ